jgi:transcription termination/antitermination protein NusA
MTPNISDIKSQIEQICVEKGLSYDEVISAIEKSIASAYRKELGDKDKSYTCEFDLNEGSYKIFENVTIVDEIAFPMREKTLAEARLFDPQAQTGDVITTQVQVADKIAFGRIASQVARQVMVQSVNLARNSKILKDYRDKVGQLVNIEIDYMKKAGFMVKMGQVTIFMNQDQFLPGEKLRPGQIIKAVIQDIREDEQGNTKITLSRTHTDFILAILRQEIPEYEAGMVVIKNIAREAGARTKILVDVADEDSNIDPVGTFLGKRNMRIISIMREISPSMQEKIDIIEYDPENIPLMIMDALEPAEIQTVEIVDSEKRLANVYCSKTSAQLAVGKRGVNIRLASKLTDYTIQVIADEE